jgi:hypothetical protein
VRAVVAVSDDPDASGKIARFAGSDQPWIVAVRMVSEGVDIPRLRIAVFATTTTTELFFRQAVGRVVRWTRGVPRQKAYFFLPDDPRLAHFATSLAEQRRHSLRKRAEADPPAVPDEPELDAIDDGDEEQMSLFAVIGSVALGESGQTVPAEEHHDEGVFGDDPDGTVTDPRDEPGVDLVLLPPPLPGGGLARGSQGNGSTEAPQTLRQRKVALRDSNADLARELVRVTGWSHPQVNAELNRLAGIRKISEATLEQLEQRLVVGRKWLKSA